jgi:hypothetical protein
MCRKKLLNPPENHYKFWENKVMRKLGKKYEDYTYEELAEIFGRTLHAVKTRIAILRIAIRMAPYTEDIQPVMVYKYSEAAKKRLQTEEGKRTFIKMREAVKTPEAEAKRKTALANKLRSEEVRLKLSNSAKGNKNRLGKPCSDELKAQISAKVKATLARKKSERK